MARYGVSKHLIVKNTNKLKVSQLTGKGKSIHLGRVWIQDVVRLGVRLDDATCVVGDAVVQYGRHLCGNNVERVD